MRSLFIGAVWVAVAGALAPLAGCGSSVPVHPTCLQGGSCPTGQICHLPPGGSTGVCANSCTAAKDCPSSEPWCVPDVDSSTLPFSFCACATSGPDAGISTGCGQNNGYGCSVELQVCLPR